MNRNFEEFLLKQRVESKSEHTGASFLSELGVTAITVYVLRNDFSVGDLLIWATVATLVSAAGFFWKFGYRQKIFSVSSSTWLRVSLVFSCAVGFTWGNIPLFYFVPNDFEYLVFIVCIYAGYVSGALSVSVAHQPSFYAYAVGISLPMAARMLIEGGDLHITIFWLMLFYLTMLFYVSKNLDKLYIKSARSQFDNMRLVEQLAEEKKTVEQAVTAKNRFLAAASHDLRQPLNVVGIYIDALKPLLVNKKAEQVVGKIKISLKALNGMLHGLLDISRLDANVIDNNPQNLRLHTGVEQLVDEYQSYAKHITIQNQVCRAHVVIVDPILLTRIVRNLLDNAVKYTPKGSVKILSEAYESSIRLSIVDTGIGIDESQLDTIFDEFQQLNNPERNRDKGLGLGLAIVKRLCHIAGIEIELNSELDKGTTIGINLLEGDAKLVQTKPAPKQINLDDLLMLILDDEVDIIDSTKQLVESWGCRTVAATDLDKALTILSQQGDTPDIIVSDLRLEHGRTGVEAIEAIREEYNLDIPAILITGDTASDRVELANSADCVVLYKPIDGQELKEQIKLLLSN